MTTLTSSAEGGTAGTTVTTGNSGGASGTAFDAVSIGTGCTDIFDNAHAAHGTLSYKLATPATAAAVYGEWSTAMGTLTTAWFRLYLYVTAFPSSSIRLFSFLSGTTLRGGIALNSAGHLAHVNAAGSTIQSGTVTVALNQWIRVEGFITGDAAAGQIETKLFNTPDSASADETLTDAATQNTGGTGDHYRFGIAASVSSIGPVWLDDLGLSSVGYIGAAGAGAPTPAGIPGNWSLAFEDLFDGSGGGNASATQLDTTNRWVNTWPGPQNNVTTQAANVAVSGGELVLTLSDASNGASVHTKSFLLPAGAAAEARIMFPGSSATAPYNWPAWWTSGANWPANGEIDIAEVLSNLMTANYHSPSGAHNLGTVAGNWANSYHTYGVYRAADHIDIYYDGVLVKTYSPTDDAGGGQNLILNVGVSGGTNSFGAPGAVHVSYVRAWTPVTLAALGTPYTVITNSEIIASGTTWQVPITHDVAFGDALVVSGFDNLTAITGVTDSAGNAYSLVQNESGNVLHTFQFVALNCAAMKVANADWIKLTFNNVVSTSQIGLIVRGCSGVATIAATDAAGTVQAFGSSAAPALSGGTALGQASEWIVSALQGSNATTGVTSWGGGFVQASQQHGSGQPYCTVADQVVAAAAAVNGSAVLPVSGTWAMQQVALKAAASAPSGFGIPYTALTASEVITSGTTYQVNLSHDVAAHDALVLTGLDSLTSVTGVTDSKGNSWVQTTSVGAVGLITRQFAAVDCAAMSAGADWIKITFGAITSSSEIAFIVRGCSGVAAAGAVDAGSTRTLSGSSATAALAGTAGLAQSPEWVVAGVSSSSGSGGPAGAWGGGFTQRQQERQTASAYLTVADQIATTGTGGRAARLVGFDTLYLDGGTAWRNANATIGPGQTHRIFYGGALPATFNADGMTDDICIHVSYKTQTTNVAAFVNSIPATRSEVWVIFNHEPEGGAFSSGAAFVAAFKSQADIVHAQGKPNVKMVMAAMAYQYGAGAGNADAQAGGYVEGLGNGYADIFACDVYQGSGGTAAWDWSSNGLQNLDHWTNWIKVVTSKTIVGTVRPLGITEYGVDDPVGDTARNARIALDRDYLISAFQGSSPISPYPLQCWCYWWIDKVGDPNQTVFSDPATIATWQAIETTSGSSVVNASVALTSSGPWAMCQTALMAGVSGAGGGGSAPSVTTAGLPAGEAGQAYSQALAATGGTAPYTWAVTSGSLPDGLALSSGGVISGTPSSAASATFTVVATDAAGAADSAALTLTVADHLAVATASLPAGGTISAYAVQLAASGGTGPLTWGVSVGSLPAGLALDPGTGVISGTPAGAGTTGFTVQVTDSYTSATAALSIVVTGTVLSVVTSSLPPGITGTAYSVTLTAANGTPAYTWSVTGGALPPGLALSSGGVLSGTPTSPGSYTATFQVTDSLAATATAVLTVTVSQVIESLVVSGHIELLGGGVVSTIPECAGATFLLTPGHDLGAPQNVAASSAAVYLDGERPVGRRASNRTVSLPVKITAPDRLTLAAAREVLLEAIDHDWWELTWSRPGGLPMVLDCFRASPAVVGYELVKEQQLVSEMVISFQALPYGRSDTPVIASFPLTLPGRAAAVSPVTIDDYSTVTGTNWSQSPIGPGPNSAFWHTGTNGVGTPATYTRSGIGPFNLAGRQAVTVWVLLGSTAFFPFSGLKQKMLAKFTITLTDGTRSISAHLTRRVRMTNNSYAPYPQKVRIPIPQGTLLNYAAVTGYTFTVSTRSAGDCPYTDVYLDSLEAVPHVRAGAAAPSGGTVADLAGTVGSARSLASIQVAQAAGTVATVVKRFSTPGAFNWLCPDNVTQVDRIECYGPGGRGGQPVTVTYCGGGGGGAYGLATSVAVVPGTVYSGFVRPGGASGTGTPGSTTFTAGAVTVTGPGGSNVGDSATGGAAGAAGTPSGFAGGAGGNGAGGPVGAGGGGAAGTAGAGLPGAPGSGTGKGGGAGPGGTDAGAGGNGAVALLLSIAAQPGHPAGGGGGGGVKSALGGKGGPGADGEVVLTYRQRGAFRTLVVHRPNPDAPDTLAPFTALGAGDVPDGTSEYPVATLVAGSNARFDGTYTVVLVNRSWHNPGAARDLTVTVTHYEQAGGTKYAQMTDTRTVTPNSDLKSPLVTLGELTLPDHRIPDDNTAAYFTVRVASTDTADRFQDVLFLDTAGSTVIVESPAAYVSYWVDEPAIGREIGNIMGSQFDRGDAVSVLAYATVSGPPLYVDPLAANQSLLLYSAEGPPAAELTYWSKWMLDRVV